MRLELEVLGQPHLLWLPGGLIMDAYEFSPGAWMEVIYPCSNAKHCGNTATTVREVQGQPVRLCESCAAEHDEGGE